MFQSWRENREIGLLYPDQSDFQDEQNGGIGAKYFQHAEDKNEL